MRSTDTVHPLDPLRAMTTRWPLVLLVTLVVGGTALGVSLTGDKQYDATVKLLVGEREEPINNLLEPGSSGGSSDPERDVNTGVEVIKAGGTAAVVRRNLGLRRSDDELLEQIDVESSSSSNIISLRARDHDPALAARIANDFARSYRDFRLNSARKRYQQAAQLAGTQLETLTPAERAAPDGQALKARQRELQIAGALQTGGAEIIRVAKVPDKPSRPRPILSTALGLSLGLLLGGFVALLLGFADRRLKTEEEIETLFGLPILGAIPPLARRAGSRAEHVQREAFGLLAANLRFTALADEGKVLMITSPSPVEGKTSVTLGLARAFALLGLRVIAIEGDLRRPAFASYATLGPSLGLTAVLSGETRLPGALVAIDVETLKPVEQRTKDTITFSMLATGALPTDPQRVLMGPLMNSTLRIARSLADVVIIDTAPVGTVSDAAGLLRMVDSTAIVVRLGATTKDAAERALRVLRNVDVELAGLIVTDAVRSEAPGYYYTQQPPADSTLKPAAARPAGREATRKQSRPSTAVADHPDPSADRPARP